jgi:predicted Zn-dependent protease
MRSFVTRLLRPGGSCYLILCLAAAAAAQQREPGRGVNFYSLEKEIALGRQLAAEFSRDNKPLESPATLAYINDLGQRLAAQIGGPPFTYTFAVIADNSRYTEAVALPGGFVFVPSAIILAAKDENELAGILAHSIAHIASRDGTKLATRSELTNIATVPLLDMGGWTGYAMREGADIAIPLGLLQMMRKSELGADNLAAVKMAAAGYDPAALSRFIDREQAPFDAWELHRVFSRLPARSERIQTIQAAINDLPAQTYPPHDGLDKIQEEVRRLTASTEPAKKPPTLGR